MSHNCYKNIKVGDYIGIEGIRLSSPDNFSIETRYTISGHYRVVCVYEKYGRIEIILGSSSDIGGPYKSYDYWNYHRGFNFPDKTYNSYLFIDTASEKLNKLGEYEKVISIHKNNEKEAKEIA